MFLALEYLYRTKLIKNFLETPCSIFLTNKATGEKLIISIHLAISGTKCLDLDPDKSYYYVRHWNANKISTDKNMVGMPEIINEFVTPQDEVFEHKSTILKGYNCLLLPLEGVPVVSQIFHPIGEENYEGYIDGIFNSQEHRIVKEIWLWENFVQLFEEEINSRIHFNIDERLKHQVNDRSSLRHQQDLVHHFASYYIWNMWVTWRTWFIEHNHCPGEIIFQSYYN